MIKEKLNIQGEEWEEYYIGLLRNEKNKRLLNYYTVHLGGLFSNGRSYQKVICFLENSKHRINVEENKGNNKQFIKIKDKYYDAKRGLLVRNTEFKKELTLIIYQEVDLDDSKRLAVKNLFFTVDNFANGELSLGDKKIIKDIALENFHSNLERAVLGDTEELFNLVSCVRTDLHDWPKNQLLSYGFKVKHPHFYDITLR